MTDLGVTEPSTHRTPGRRPGTDYRGIDAPRHVEMRRLLDNGMVPNLTQAAWAVVDHAYGYGTPESKVTRLVRTYPYPY